MEIELMIGMRTPCDTRFTILRFIHNGKKVSISLHPFLFRYKKYHREFRLTIMGVNVHYRRY